MFGDGNPLARWTAENPLVVVSYAAGSLSLASLTSGTVDARTLARAYLLAPGASGAVPVSIIAVHGTGTAEYFEWVPGTNLAVTVLSGADVFTATPEGTFVTGNAGVGAWVARAGSFELPGIAIAPFPRGSSASLRVEPSPIEITLPRTPGAPEGCVTARTFVTPASGSPERMLTPLEGLAVRRSSAPDPFFLTTTPASALEFCVAWSGATARMASATLQFLGTQTTVMVHASPSP